MVYLLKHGFDPLDPATYENPAAVFMEADSIESQPDGSVAFKLASGRFGGQEPNVYGGRNDSDGALPYQRFTKNGSLVTTVTRPGDQMYVYLCVSGRAYP